MATITPEVLHAALGAAGKVDPNAAMAAAGGGGPQSMTADPAQSSTGAGGPMGAPPTGDPSLDPTAGGAQDPGQAAVWAAFPGTDPQAAQTAMRGGDMQAALASLFDAQAADVEKLNAMHKALMEALLSSVAAPDASQSSVQPSGPGMDGGPAIPGVGGSTGGYS